jgi:NADH:ubiquinone oxidoreductase subunit C
LEGQVQEVIVERERRVSIRTAKELLRWTIEELTGIGSFQRLLTITGVDAGAEIEVIYHLAFEKAVVSLKIRVRKETPELLTIFDLVPNALLYEREVHDLLGVRFNGNPDLSPLLLPDTWLRGIFPLRKEWTLQKMAEEMKLSDEDH